MDQSKAHVFYLLFIYVDLYSCMINKIIIVQILYKNVPFCLGFLLTIIKFTSFIILLSDLLTQIKPLRASIYSGGFSVEPYYLIHSGYSADDRR